MRRIEILDGWRASSILLVLAGHLLPLGPSSWGLNAAVAVAGMAIFFTLSGFLITQILLERPDVPAFLVRRLFRILPLAWAAVVVLALATGASLVDFLRNFLFVANVPPFALMHGGEHLWSLGVEVQFYAGVALLVAVLGRRGLYLLPVLAAAVTVGRILTGATLSIQTWQRVDEILAGATLALVWHHLQHREAPTRVPAWLSVATVPLLLASAHPSIGALGYVRPYLAAAAVGFSLFAAPALMVVVMTSRPARYIADISYALYVIHAMLSVTWLGDGSTVVKYAKRPLLFVALFAAAHLSTYYYEKPMTALGRKVGSRRSVESAVPVGGAHRR